MKEKQRVQEAYMWLEGTIQERQNFEASHAVVPYSTHKTTLDYRNPEGKSLLNLAIALGDKDKVKALYEQGVDTQGALSSAVEFGHLNIAQYLYEKGEDATQISLSDIRDPACRQWFIDLIKEKLKIVPQYAKSKTQFFELPANQVFVKNKGPGRDVDEKDYFDRITELGAVDLLENIISGENESLPFALNWSMQSMMIHAASNNQVNMLQWLVKHNGEVNSKFKFSESALIAASVNNNLEALDFLIANGADINYAGKDKLTALQFAVLYGHEKIVERLLKEKVDLLATNTFGYNVLHYAVLINNKAMISLLLQQPEAKKLLEAQNVYGLTALDYAIEDNNPDAIALLSQGQDVVSKKTTPFVRTDQSSVMKKMRYYLASQYRNLDFFSRGGHCNGFAFYVICTLKMEWKIIISTL